ncbi:MAG: hypothetical protein HY057_07925 [Rhodospirillales bacterium]|nr:hypothetical protein [Rhodospirillales bacterium]
MAAQSGDCGSQALAGATGSFAGPLIPSNDFAVRLVSHAVIGGTTSVLAGGKFQNGAVTAAFGYLFNEVALACRDVAGSPFNHCGLFVYQGNDTATAKIDAQFSLGGGNVEFNKSAETSAKDLEAFQSGKNVYKISPPDGISQKDFDALVIGHANSYRAPTYRMLSGPNSNSAATYPIYKSGGSVPTIPRAPAIDYWETIDRLGLKY